MATLMKTNVMNHFPKKSGGMTARIRSRMVLHLLFLILILVIATVTSLQP